MFEKILTTLSNVFSLLPFTSATWFIIAIISFFIFLFIRAQHTPDSPIDWEDLIIDTITNRTSPYKLGYLIGLVVATWVVISLTDKDKLTLDIFGIYLTYLLGGAGWGFAKKSTPPTADVQVDIQETEEKKTFQPPPG